MKKKQTPIIPITLLVLIICVVSAMNFPKELLPKPGSAPAPAANDTLPEAPSKEAIGKKIAGSVKDGGGRKKQMDMEEQPDTGPALAMPKRAPYKPVPNDSSTSTQWYTDATQNEKKKG